MEPIFSAQSAGIVNNALKTNRIALWDADYMKYILTSRMAAKLDKSVNIYSDRRYYLPILWREIINEVLEKIQDPIIFCFSGKSFNTFRYHLAVEKEYKGNRPYKEDYEGASDDALEFVQMTISKYNSLVFADLEADDIVSALQDPATTYIASKDKDLKQVPGFHYNWSTNTIYEISKEEALRHLCYQLVRGDTTDNIPGMKGIGDDKANKFFNRIGDNVKEYPEKILGYYCDTYGIFNGMEMFAEMLLLLKMRTARGEWFNKKYIKMFDLKKHILIELEKKKIAEFNENIEKPRSNIFD